MYYVLFENENKRNDFMNLTFKMGVNCVFHYIPLHSSPAGKRYGKVNGKMNVTDNISSRLLRMPLWVGIEKHQKKIFNIFEKALKQI